MAGKNRAKIKNSHDYGTYNAARSNGHVTQSVPAIVPKTWCFHGTNLQADFDPNKHCISVILQPNRQANKRQSTL